MIARIVVGGGVVEAQVEGEWVHTAGGDRIRVSEAHFAPPCQPTKIICVGFNYRDHAAELGVEPPKEPLMFLKPPSSVVGHGAPVPYPRHTSRFEYEAEMAVVIGRRARRVSASDALDYVAGYTCFNDLTARDVQEVEKQWFRAKAFDASAPLGPWIVSGLDTSNLGVFARVNGEVRQAGNTSDMVFDVPTLIEVASSFATLEPGDVIATGTPRGIGRLQVGDIVEIEIEGIGVLRNTVVADSDA